MIDYQERSPFRRLFNWVIMPTVDASPQNEQWIATYANADAVFSYSDWGGSVLKDESNGKINYLGTAAPSAHAAYNPTPNKKTHKEKIKGNSCKNWQIFGFITPSVWISFRFPPFCFSVPFFCWS